MTPRAPEGMSNGTAARVLVVEDDASLRGVLCDELLERGHQATGVAAVAAAIAALGREEFDVVIADLMLPDGSGIEVLRHIAAEGLPTEAIVLTGYADVQSAIEAMKLGAHDYLTKPARTDEIDLRVCKAAEKSRLRRENDALRDHLLRGRMVEGMVTQDPAMKGLLETIARVAPSDLPVVVLGESGTGKELVARALHRLSPRSKHPFVAVSCAALPENLLESELFGHERGAFTGAVDRKAGLFELAHRGVLFLDEIGEVSPAVQVKLLRVIETRQFYRVGGTRVVDMDVRLVSATNRDLSLDVKEGRFRADLAYRLNGLSVTLPPLRERPGDVPLLARHLLERLPGKKKLSRGALLRLEKYGWPGNVRELGMVLHRAAILSTGDTIQETDLPADLAGPGMKGAAWPPAGLTLSELEQQYIQRLLEQNKGNRGKTARALGIDPKTLYNKLKAGEAE